MIRQFVAIVLSLLITIGSYGQSIITPVSGVATIDVGTCGQGGASPNPSCTFKLTLAANTTIAFNNVFGGASVNLFINPSTFTVTWPSSVTPTPTLTASQNNLVSLRYDGASNTWTGIGGGGGGVSSSYGPLAFSCANCNPNVQYAFAVTCNNLSTTIATGANDPPFVAGDVGKIIVGNDAFGHAANCPPQGTITAFGGAHSVTVSLAATATITTGSLAWGTQDDGANLRNAFLASLGKGCLYLPAGNMFAGAAGSDSVNLFIDNRSAGTTGFPPCVIGQGNTNITPLPTFNYGNCFLNGACAFHFAQAGNVLPNYGLAKDWEILGINGMTLTGSGSTNFWVDWQRATIRNVWLWNIGTGTQYGMAGAGPSVVFGTTVNGTGNTSACAALGTGGSSAGMNQIVTLEQGYCQGANGSLFVAGGAALKTKGMQFGSPNASGSTVLANGIWDSSQDGISSAFGNAATVSVGATSFTNLIGDWVIGAVSNTVGAIRCNASGGTVSFQNTNIDGGTGGVALFSVAGCNIRNNGNNKIVQGTLSLSGNNFSAVSETQTGACTTNAATVTFKGTYIAVPLVLVSDSTSASTGAQVTATNATTATIHCNGASDTFTATVIPNPI